MSFPFIVLASSTPLCEPGSGYYFGNPKREVAAPDHGPQVGSPEEQVSGYSAAFTFEVGTMNQYEALRFLGKYVVVGPAVISVFGQGRSRSHVRRYWPFLVNRYSHEELHCVNTATHHNLTISLSEITDCYGDIDTASNYRHPLRLQLTSQLFWDAFRVWRRPLNGFMDESHRRAIS